MALEPIIVWNAPEHIYKDKGPDWYWIVGIITLALAAVAVIFDSVITAIFIVVAVSALVIHASRPSKHVPHQINDRGIMVDEVFYPFTSLESFWLPHDIDPPRLLIKSRKIFSPYIVIYIDEIDPEDVRQVLLRYIAETEHHESLIKHLLERLGF